MCNSRLLFVMMTSSTGVFKEQNCKGFLAFLRDAAMAARRFGWHFLVWDFNQLLPDHRLEVSDQNWWHWGEDELYTSLMMILRLFYCLIRKEPFPCKSFAWEICCKMCQVTIVAADILPTFSSCKCFSMSRIGLKTPMAAWLTLPAHHSGAVCDNGFGVAWLF